MSLQDLREYIPNETTEIKEEIPKQRIEKKLPNYLRLKQDIKIHNEDEHLNEWGVIIVKKRHGDKFTKQLSEKDQELVKDVIDSKVKRYEFKANSVSNFLFIYRKED